MRRAPSLAPQRRPSGTPSTQDVAVVAADGSEASVRALVWTLDHATRHDLTVEVLTTWPLRGPVFVREVPGHFCEPRWRARALQAEALARALEQVGAAPEHLLRVENATVVDALARASRRAAVVVIGSDVAPRSSLSSLRMGGRVRAAVAGRLVVVGPSGAVVTRGSASAADLDADAGRAKAWRDSARALENELLLEYGDRLPPGQVLSVTARAIRACRREYGADPTALELAERRARHTLAELSPHMHR
jgi:hypothetical protein